MIKKLPDHIKTVTFLLTLFFLFQCKHSNSSEPASSLSNAPAIGNGVIGFNLDHWQFFHELGQLSIASYQDPDSIDEFLGQTNYPLSKLSKSFIEAANVQAYFIETESNIIIVFRGTEKNLDDFVTDISVFPPVVDFSRYKDTHPGFLKAYEAIQPDIYNSLTSSIKSQQRKPLILVGHSLGGSLATVAALDLHRAGYPISNVVTYGAPPAFRKKMAEEYNNSLRKVTYRFINNFDLIPSLLTKILGFKHVGHPIFFKGEDCLATLEDKFRARVLNFKDHAMLKYLGCFLRQY